MSKEREALQEKLYDFSGSAVPEIDSLDGLQDYLQGTGIVPAIARAVQSGRDPGSFQVGNFTGEALKPGKDSYLILRWFHSSVLRGQGEGYNIIVPTVGETHDINMRRTLPPESFRATYRHGSAIVSWYANAPTQEILRDASFQQEGEPPKSLPTSYVQILQGAASDLREGLAANFEPADILDRNLQRTAQQQQL